MSVFDSGFTLFHCFLPKNHCLAQFGQDGRFLGSPQDFLKNA